MAEIIKKNQTVFFKNKPRIIGNYSIVGPKEGNGPFKEFFHYVMNSDLFGEKTYEKAERKMLQHAIFGAIDNARLDSKDIDMLLCGDLLNQIVTSSFAARSFDVLFLGVFGACSTMALSLAVGSCMVNAGYFNKVVCGTSSHFSSAERQFRFPLELGNQRPPTAQWTVTGSGATVLSKDGEGPFVSCATFGKVVDFGICDVNNMGAAMAPSAAATLIAHFYDTKTKPSDYDIIFTGDLGKIGSEILIDLLEEEGFKLGTNYTDCGQVMFYNKAHVNMGGSGCGCGASILNSYVLQKVREGVYKKVLFVATGALLSTLTCQQGESIPGISHAVVIEKGD